MPIPITYTFGNHMHWADMEWLWGYHVLPGSVQDMLRFCRESGAKGNVNFDGIGYEKLAAESPEAFAELKAAVQSGAVEVVGGSYGQPYGLFHGGESNVRQRVYGARTIRRLFGVGLRTFWEEEFDFFPQLPQILAGCGFEFASLFFQWTWHSPELPMEPVPVVDWEAPDGSRLRTATRNRLNLHQWPEDIQILMDELAVAGTRPGDLILQWLELMPSPDWMCRSELLLPKTKQLLGDPRFEVHFATLGDFLACQAEAPVRRYTMDDVWHGMSLGKNGDRHPRRSHEVERELQSAEFLYALLGRFGRPYAQWDVYPVWELEEAWRNLLGAQHHDNHECEGLCGRVGYAQFGMAQALADPVRGLDLLERRAIPPEGGWLVVNPFGWRRAVLVQAEAGTGTVEVPSFGYRVVGPDDVALLPVWTREGDTYALRSPEFGAVVDPGAWSLRLRTAQGQRSLSLPAVEWHAGGQLYRSDRLASEPTIDGQALSFLLEPEGHVAMWLGPAAGGDSLDLVVSFEPCGSAAALDSGIGAGVHVVWNLTGELWVDQPYGISRVSAESKRPRKYPTGDWMTSPQRFETVENPFESQSLVDVVESDGSGLLILHDGSMQWLRRNDSLRSVLTMRDPWDEDRFETDARVLFRLHPHAGVTSSDRYRRSRELFGSTEAHCRTLPAAHPPEAARTPDLPAHFSLLSCDAPNVALTALYRETSVVSPAGRTIDYPFVLRLVEFDGRPATARLRVAATVAEAFETNYLGEAGKVLSARDGTIQVKLRPFGIHTVYLDLVEGRKQVRDLDAKREVWATVHRV
ncbi:MAG TPA: hypothetical protein VKT78_19670 [Fimbriimonadaceae bacterium]|nr:hypothetical protein [Fimbriimonadaceae bacterium]